MTLGVRYLLGDQGLSTILVGAATPAEVEESVSAAEAGPLPRDLLDAVEELVPP